MREPLVSVGLPVYNGERYLREALDSILGQTYANLELVISDNASTDGTEAICREYAARDPRVRYHRAARNGGAVWNFNRAFELARGEYFLWNAFDDAREPECVARCVAALEARPDAVLCCTGIRLVDEDGAVIPPAEFPHGERPSGPTAEARLSAIARSTYWYDFYGVARRAALARTRLCRPVWGFDVVLLLELCLMGPVLEVPEALFRYRIFRRKTGVDAASTLATVTTGGAIPMNWTEFSLALLDVVRRADLPAAERRRLAARLRRELVVHNPVVCFGFRPRDPRDAAIRAIRARRWDTLGAVLRFSAGTLPRVLLRRAVASVRYRATRGATPAPRGE
jgi:hypothetical protein